jgi:hypothetical protein
MDHDKKDVDKGKQEDHPLNEAIPRILKDPSYIQTKFEISCAKVTKEKKEEKKLVRARIINRKRKLTLTSCDD